MCRMIVVRVSSGRFAASAAEAFVMAMTLSVSPDASRARSPGTKGEKMWLVVGIPEALWPGGWPDYYCINRMNNKIKLINIVVKCGLFGRIDGR